MARKGKAQGKAAKPPLPKLKSKPAKGGSVLKTLFTLAVLGGLGYAAVTVPIQGRTAFRRACDAFPYQLVRKGPTVSANEPARKKAGPKAPAESISQADRDALERLLPH